MNSLLESYAWPGNIRELRNVIERALILAGEGAILPQHLPKELLARAPAATSTPPAPVEAGGPATTAAVLTLEELEKRDIRQVLGQCRGNKTRAAERLGISRLTLRNKVK